MGKIQIENRKNGVTDVIPICNVIVDGKTIAMVASGKKIEFELDNYPHQIQCSYTYANNRTEKSNYVQINDNLNHHLIVGAVADTHIKRAKENLKHLLTKGYMNVPDIKLYEIIH